MRKEKRKKCQRKSFRKEYREHMFILKIKNYKDKIVYFRQRGKKYVIG